MVLYVGRGLFEGNSTNTGLSKKALETLEIEKTEKIIYQVGVFISVVGAIPTLVLIARVYSKNRELLDVSRMMALMFGVLACNTVYNLQSILIGGNIHSSASKESAEFEPTGWCTFQAFITQNTLIPSTFLMACFTCEINNIMTNTGSRRVSGPAKDTSRVRRLSRYALLSFGPSLLISLFYFVFQKFGPSRKWYVQEVGSKNRVKNKTAFSMCWIDVGDLVSIVFSYMPMVVGLLITVYFLASIGKHLFRASGGNREARDHFNSIFLKMTYLPGFTFACFIPAILYLIFTAIANSSSSKINSAETDKLWYEPTMSYLVTASLSLISFVQSMVIVLTNARVRKEAKLIVRCCTDIRNRRLSRLQDAMVNNSNRPLICESLIATDDEEDDSEFDDDPSSEERNTSSNRSQSFAGPSSANGDNLMEEPGRSKSIGHFSAGNSVYHTM